MMYRIVVEDDHVVDELITTTPGDNNNSQHLQGKGADATGVSQRQEGILSLVHPCRKRVLSHVSYTLYVRAVG